MNKSIFLIVFYIFNTLCPEQSLNTNTPNTANSQNKNLSQDARPKEGHVSLISAGIPNPNPQPNLQTNANVQNNVQNNLLTTANVNVNNNLRQILNSIKISKKLLTENCKDQDSESFESLIKNIKSSLGVLKENLSQENKQSLKDIESNLSCESFKDFISDFRKIVASMATETDILHELSEISPTI
jgi:hypothetical protein